ncbi:TIGR03826 family flagellar region protein [Gracilibacillus sp. S3-1-1]|uniref:TIGR03826 family flagellar region protein n=1 Tax=Gracilibacillus pellucidus TaxID=3095368 RepID=A0ACC6M0X1_9BACI|nr:TIGR03826 family flagellar region protein [Gracilibacillus sp. S3-1-1]MDX8044594.1 TIGR03826 family flagellar region protein [Gracilibacillus sp. S3-1-1]
MAELANCIRCDKVFVKTTSSVCPECIKEEEKQFQIVYKFLKKRENRQATIPEIVEATGVKEDIILQFVRDNRLRTSHFPNLAYPCERCETPITKGKLCSNCQGELTSDLNYAAEVERVKQKNEAKVNEAKTYYTRDND